MNEIPDISKIKNTELRQPPPQALPFWHGRGERETRVTGDEPQGTMGRLRLGTRQELRATVYLCNRRFYIDSIYRG